MIKFFEDNIKDIHLGENQISKVYLGEEQIYPNEVPPPIVNNKIYYTSTDGNIIEPFETTGWSANIISNTYVDGVGCIEFDDVITEIPSGAFYRRFNLTSIVIPDGVETIGDIAFDYCESLTSVSIGSGCTSIGQGAFEQCDRLPNINIPDSVKIIGTEAFYDCLLLSSVTIGNGCTSIGQEAFSRCRTLRSINIPDSVETIGDSAFAYCQSLPSVSIGYRCSEIGSLAFQECTSLSSIISIATVAPTVQNDTFFGITEYGTLIFPFGSDYSSWLSTDQFYLGYYHWNEAW